MSKTIDQLNFQVILDDKEFNDRIEKDIKKAKELNTELSKYLTIKSQILTNAQLEVEKNRKAQQILVDNARAQEKINREKVKTEGLQRKINAQIERASQGYKNQSRILSELKNYALGYLSISGVSKLLSSLVQVTGEFELQKTTLAAMIGDLNKAEGIITRIQGLAVESPFQFKELTTYAKQLSAFSVPAEELYETTKMLADISAGLGVGMDRIVLAYGQVRSAAFLRGQEVRQFTEAGIPILNELAKQFSELEGRAVSAGEVFDKISARLVPFEMVAKVFKDMTSEGGKFYQMQEVQAETLKGKISNLKDAYEMMLNEIGSAHSDKLKGAVDWVRGLMQNWQSIGGQLLDLIKLFGAYKAAVTVLNISDTITKFGGLANAIRKTAAAQALMNSALLTNPYIAVGMAITTVALAINRQRKELDATARAQDLYNKRVSELARIDRERSGAIRDLIGKVQDETQATIEREAALLSLKKFYPQIFEQYDIESLKLADILNIKKQIAEEDAKQKKTAAIGAIGAQEGRIKALIARGAGATQKENAWAYLYEMEKDYLKNFVLPDMVAGLKDLTDEALNKALDDAFRKSQYNVRGVEKFDNIPTSKEFYEDLYQSIQAEISKRKNTKEVDGWRKKINDVLTGMGLKEGTSFGLWAKETTQSTQYVEDLIKRYKELKDQIKYVSSFDEKQAENLKKNQLAIQAIAKELKIDIDDFAANKSEKTESEEEKRIRRLIDALRKLEDQYEKLKNAGESDENIKSFFLSHYADLAKEQGEGFVTSLNYLEQAKKLIVELSKYNPNLAKKLAVDIGGDEFGTYLKKLTAQQKAYKETAKAAGDYFNTLRKWQTEDFNIGGEGIGFDLSKILSDLNEKIAEIELRVTKAREIFGNIDLDSEEEVSKVKEIFVKEFGADAWAEFWASYKEKGFSAIRDLAEAQRNAEIAIAQEKARDAGKKYAKELLKNGSVGLTELSDKTYRQLNDMADKVNELIKEKINEMGKIDSEEYDLTEEEKAKLLALEETIKELGLSLDVIVDEKTEKMIKDFKAIGSAAQGIATSIKEIGGASEEITLGDQLLDSYSKAGSMIESILEGGPVGAILSAIQIIADGIKKTLNGAVESVQKINDKLKEYRDLVVSINRESYEQIAGTNELGLFEYNTQSLDDFKKDFDDTIQAIDMLLKKPQKIFSKLDLTLPEGGFDNTEDYLDFIENLELQFAELGGRLSKREKEAIKVLIDQGKQLSDAAAEQATYLSSLYSNVADDIADAFITAFKESGEAALDYGEIMEDIATQLMKDVVKKSLLEQVFTDENIKKISDAINTGDYDKALAETEGMMQMAEGLLPGLERVFEILGKYLDKTDNEDVVTAADGIKGVTEDTANLLASYMNAMRADGSLRNTLITQLNGNVQQIFTTLNAYIPSLAEYQAQIAANTYDTAVATQGILSRLDSVITSEGGLEAIRTYS